MLAVGIDMSEVKALAARLNAAEDQIPYAMMLALNQATEETRRYLIQTTWPTHIHQRNASFIAASLTTKERRASKTQLETEIYDKLGRGHLMAQAKGGVRTPVGRGHMAVPVSSLVQQKTGRGVPKALQPKVLGPKGIRIKDAIYTRDRRSNRLRLLYVLKTATRIPKRVPFFEDYKAQMSAALAKSIPVAFARAMATRRPR